MKDPISHLISVREKLSEIETRIIKDSEMIRLLKIQLDRIEDELRGREDIRK